MAKKSRLRLAYAALFFWLLVGVLPPLSVGAEDHPGVQLILALDTSGSMKSNDPSRLMPKAANVIVNLLEDRDYLGLLSFDENAAELLPLGPLNSYNRQKGLRELLRLKPQGAYTDIYTALREALKSFDPQGPGQRVLVLLTDGHMDISLQKGDSKAYVAKVQQEIIPAYKKAGIPIYTVAFTPQSDQVLLKELAEETGGRFILITKAPGLHQAFLRVYENLKHPQLAPITGNRFLIDAGVQEAVLVATRSLKGKPVILEDPEGKRITLENAPRSMRWFSTTAYDMVTIPKPRPGYWTLSNYQEGEGKVILMTDLKLTCPHLSETLGSDEALWLGAAILEKGKLVTAPEFLQQTVFQGELQGEVGDPVTIELQAPPPEQAEFWPPGTRVGKFPAFNTPGQWQLKVLARGKTFQREMEYSLKVSSPWYKVELVPGVSGRPPRLKFIPNRERKTGQLWGGFSVRLPSGSIVSAFLKPTPGTEFTLPLVGGNPGPLVGNLNLRGTTASGRPLAIQPAPLRLDLTAASVTSTPEPSSPGRRLSLKQRLRSLSLKKLLPDFSGTLVFWLTLALLAALALLGMGAFFYLRHHHLYASFSKKSLENLTLPDDVSMEDLKLLLIAKVEFLEKERNQLKAAMGEMGQQLGELTAEKVRLTAELEKALNDAKESSLTVKELKKKVEEAEADAKRVHDEYMALYARDEFEKKKLKRA